MTLFGQFQECVPYSWCIATVIYIYMYISWCFRYRKKAALYEERIQELNEISQEVAEIKKNHDDLRKQRYKF